MIDDPAKEITRLRLEIAQAQKQALEQLLRDRVEEPSEDEAVSGRPPQVTPGCDRLDFGAVCLFGHPRATMEPPATDWRLRRQLQLATCDSARALFDEEVIDPASGAATGLEQLRQLTENYLLHVQNAYPGGCFFASLISEIDTHAGPVRDRAVEFMAMWLALRTATIREAQAQGAIDPTEDAEQLTFQIEAYLFLANAQFVISKSSEPIVRARRAIQLRLDAAGRGVLGDDALAPAPNA